jgi:hypothetical protein
VGYILERDDIRIESEDVVICERKVIPDLQNKHVFVEDSLYQNYKPTGIQFVLSSATPMQKIQITIPYANRLTNTEAKYCRICFYDGVDQWRVLDTTLDEEQKILQTTLTEVGIIGVFLNDYWYSDFTQRIADEFPIWTAIRNSRESNGQRFLNYFAMAFEEATNELDEIKAQRFIDTLDVQMLDWVYVYELPAVQPQDELYLYDGEDPHTRTTIPILTTLRQFFFNKEDGGGIIDYDNRRFYALKYYEHFNGEIVNPITRRCTFKSDGLPHQIWNAFDEFGLLVNLKRLYRESNASYKERIKDVFRYPSNSGDLGLTHALARELNLIDRVTWKDDTKNLFLKVYGIDPRTLRIDGQPLQPNEYAVDEFGYILIHARNEKKSHTVSFIRNIQKYELHDKNNAELNRLMFEPDGQASETLERWVEYIKQVAPVMWGQFNWDEGYWDTISKELTGLGYLPNIWDSDITIWKDYTFDPKRWEGSKIWQS